jgi:GcrA cell cycle regulator
MLCQFSHRSTPDYSPVLAEGNSGSRRRWTAGELTEIVAALATLRTASIAQVIGVNPKALRSVLRRQGISLRALREKARRAENYKGTGLLLRRPAAGPSAVYGAAALAFLPDSACRWPLGDPAGPGFAYCGAPRLGRRPYCGLHVSQALRHEDGHGR